MDTPQKNMAKKYIKKKTIPPQNQYLIKTRVLDFTVWNGFKFGFGLTIGVVAFGAAASLVGFLLKLLVAGCLVLWYGSGGGPIV